MDKSKTLVDGLDEDGVVCDYAAHAAALERFTTATAAADEASFVSPPRDPRNKAAVKAKLDGAAEWIKASDRAHRAARHAEAEATECASRAKTLLDAASAAMAACSAEEEG